MSRPSEQGQPPPSALFPMPNHSPLPPPPASAVKQFRCNVLSCARQFTRKEHLTRHLKSHNPHLGHKCPICGRRYARSDVLKRHVEYHPQITTDSNATPTACSSCHDRKLKCDTHTPCCSCARIGVKCNRLSSSEWNGLLHHPTQAVDGHDATDNDQVDQPMTDQGPDMGVLTSAIADRNSPQQAWTMLTPDAWKLSSSFVTADDALGTSLSGEADFGTIASWQSMIEDSRTSSSAAEAAQGIAVTFPTTTPPVVGSISSASGRGTDMSSHATPPQLQSAPSMTSVDENQDMHLRNLLDKPGLVTRLLKTFFADVHPIWPLLHAPTFEAEHTAHVLLGAIVMLASWMEGGTEHLELSPCVYELVLDLTRPERILSLCIMQALLLCVVYAICCRHAEGMLAKAVRLNSILITSCRCLGIFSNQHVLPDRVEGCAFSTWLAKEQLHRLAFSVLRVDAYLSLLLDHPPSVRYQELCIPLPKTFRLWTAATEEQRRTLQWVEPAGREKALFSFLMRDVLDLNRSDQIPYRLNEVDYHLGTCAMQVGTWEAACEAHSSASDEIMTKLLPGQPMLTWRRNLQSWYTSMERDCRLSRNYFAESSTLGGPSHALAAVTLIMWHMSAIKMHAPLALLRTQGSPLGGPAPAMHMFRARIRTWITSQCTRNAVWNAARISRIVSRELSIGAPRLLLNPLAVPGMLMSAIVTCAYAYYTRACPACSDALTGNRFDMFTVKDETVARWKECGEGWGVWGSSGISLCHCQSLMLAGWFSEALARDKNAQIELQSFVDRLGLT